MLKRLLSPRTILVGIALLVLTVAAFAQDGPPPMQEQRQRDDVRPNLIAQLGLTSEQVQQFRRLNAEHRPLINEAQVRMREATRDLDMAIYADVISEETVREKLRAFQEAQANINRLRFGNELAIRKILTLEQLVRFRGMRRQMAQERQQNERQDLRPRRDMMPSRGPGNTDRRPRPVDNKRVPLR